MRVRVLYYHMSSMLLCFVRHIGKETIFWIHFYNPNFSCFLLQVQAITAAGCGKQIIGGYSDDDTKESGYLEALAAVTSPTCS